MSQVLALLQGQKAAMDEQKVAMAGQNAAMSMMEISLCNFEAMIDCHLQDQGKETNQHSCMTMQHDDATWLEWCNRATVFV